MNNSAKNSLCREILNIKEVAELQLAEAIATTDLTLNEKRNLSQRASEVVERNFNTVVDKILEMSSEGN